MCGKDETKTVENRPPEEIMAAYRDLLGRSQSLIDQPDQFYSGDRLAGFTPQQQQAFQTIAGAGNVMDPYLEKASSYLDRAGTPIAPMAFSPEAVNQYMSPYIGNVVNATQAQFSNQNLAEQAKLMGNMASAGAWGGNRSAVLQAQLANQQQLAQAPVIADLYNKGYGQALSQFNTQQGVDLEAQKANIANALAVANAQQGLGQADFSNTLAGAGANLAAGTLQQQQNQAGLNTEYQKWLEQVQAPYQKLNWYSSIVGGAAPNMGGSKTQTTPGDFFGDVIGTGLTAAGMFMADGGVVSDEDDDTDLDIGDIGGTAGSGGSGATIADARDIPLDWVKKAAPTGGFDYQPEKPSIGSSLMRAGAAILSSPSNNTMRRLGTGIAAGLEDYEKKLDLDRNPKVDNSGLTTRIFYPSEKRWIDTGIPTAAAVNTMANRQYRQDALDLRRQSAADTLAQRRAEAQDREERAAADRALRLQIAGMAAEGRSNFGGMQAGKGMDANGKLVDGVYSLDRRTGTPVFTPGAVLTAKAPAPGAGAVKPATAIAQARKDYQAWVEKDKAQGGEGVVYNKDGSTADPAAWISDKAQQYINRGNVPAQPRQAAPRPAGALPAAAASLLKPGIVTTFNNGQKWTLENGKPVQVQ